ncbi:MAG TPA: CsbD family protein [Candidatus Ruania gallistercoris]|uniref:CsbD family protein n=1 Tax=Candidatus Ruania gallistercoris TaxID=2838746 RepID=A0A9D2EIE3_9MICO|nr:CsbD family protein [Candidatus Ruania gallistercoris]
MGLGDKFDNAAEGAAGKAKETVGKATDDEELEAEGRKDQVVSDVKKAGEKIKDAFNR